MEVYYDDLRARWHAKKIFVYPTLFGVHEWQTVDNVHILYELHDGQRHLRLAVRDNILITDLTPFGKAIKPRECTVESLISALKKTDNVRIDGYIVITVDGALQYAYSYSCVCAQLQFNQWLSASIPLCGSLDELQDLISATDDAAVCFFCCKFFFYHVASLAYDDESHVLHQLLARVNLYSTYDEKIFP